MNLTGTNNSTSYITNIKVILVQDVEDLGWGSNSRERTIVKKTGKDFIDLPFNIGTAQFNEQSKSNVQGLLFSQDLSFSIAGINDNNEDVLSKIERQPFIAVLTYTDGTSKIIGSKDNWALLNWKAKSELNIDNDLSINCNSLVRAYNYVE